MLEDIRDHLTVIVIVCLAGILTGVLAFIQIRNGAANMDVGTFSNYAVVVPCVIMFVCSVVIMVTAKEINRQLYTTVAVICVACGFVSMIVTSVWLSEPSIAASLLSNSEEGTTITPIMNMPLIVLRNVAAYFVVPTVGSILGAWLGSRLHPMRREAGNRRKRR